MLNLLENGGSQSIQALSWPLAHSFSPINDPRRTPQCLGICFMNWNQTLSWAFLTAPSCTGSLLLFRCPLHVTVLNTNQAGIAPSYHHGISVPSIMLKNLPEAFSRVALSILHQVSVRKQCGRKQSAYKVNRFGGTLVNSVRSFLQTHHAGSPVAHVRLDKTAQFNINQFLPKV